MPGASMTSNATQEAGSRFGEAVLRTGLAIERAQRGSFRYYAAQGATMAEPASSTAGGFFLWKALGGVAAFAALGAALASVVAMCMMTPRSPKEWAVGIISSVMSSLGGGALLVIKLGLHERLPTETLSLFVSLVAMMGLVFACGLPGWALVRAVFTWLAKREGMDIGELARAARADAAKVIAP